MIKLPGTNYVQKILITIGKISIKNILLNFEVVSQSGEAVRNIN